MDSEFPDIKYTLGNEQGSAIITMKGSEFMTYDSPSSKCNSLIRSLSALDAENYWLMGTPFYRAVETAHDLEGQKVGFRSITSGTVELGNALVQGAVHTTLSFAVLASLAIWTVLF